jgi:hypothetical protein
LSLSRSWFTGVRLPVRAGQSFRRLRPWTVRPCGDSCDMKPVPPGSPHGEGRMSPGQISYVIHSISTCYGQSPPDAGSLAGLFLTTSPQSCSTRGQGCAQVPTVEPEDHPWRGGGSRLSVDTHKSARIQSPCARRYRRRGLRRSGLFLAAQQPCIGPGLGKRL